MNRFDYEKRASDITEVVEQLVAEKECDVAPLFDEPDELVDALKCRGYPASHCSAVG